MKNNPYVGPRPYEWKDRDNFYGRDREARELRALVVAEREVLFYAQSGAGKTSLLNALVIPALEEKGFHVLPTVRVGSEPPPEVDTKAVDNIFILSALLALAGEDVDPQTLLPHTLRSFLKECYPESEDDFEFRPLVLIFDQFEELFTTHQERWPERRGFFEQIREALDALPSLGVVFAMREDHVAGMDPYVPLFPRRLRARFRMERLGPQGALAAVAKPALNAGCPFDPGVAEKLVDNLRRIKVRFLERADGLEDTYILGPVIEPVQLQVVCHRLWENLPEQEDQAIQWEEVEEYWDVDRALIDFYESALRAAMQETGVSDRQLRRWFSQQLITPMGTRGLALRGQKETAGLPNAAVDVLSRLYLIRADVRAGARWYELAHDRLVEPIMASNQAWLDQHQNPLTIAAKAWLASGKDPLKLLKGNQLKEAQAQAQANPDDLTKVEKEFVNISAETVRHETARRQRLILLGTGSLLIFFAALTAWALLSARSAVLARDQAEAASTLAVANAGTARAERATAQAASTAAMEQQAIAVAERNSAVTVRAELAYNLEVNMTAQASAAEATAEAPTFTPTPTPTPTSTPTNTPTPAAATAFASPAYDTPTSTPTPSPSPSPTATPTPLSTPTPNLAATATTEALQTQLYEVRATQTAVAVDYVPFIDGIVTSFGGARGDWLLKDPKDETSGIMWVPVGTHVTLLSQGEGSLSYGSGQWYLVSLVAPDTNQVIEGWLPAEVVTEAQQTAF